MYVAIEGIDTCGKSTQIQNLKAHFKDAIFTKEPGGSKLGERLREIILFGDIHSHIAEFMLFLSDRAEHIDTLIKPNIDKLVISDRSLISGIAYASNIPNVARLNLFATQNIIPNLVVILKLDAATLTARLGSKRSDKIESRGIKYLLDIQDKLFDACVEIQNLSNQKVEILSIDASDDINSITKTIIHKIQNL